MQQRDNSPKKKHKWTLFSKAFNIHSRQGNANENCFALSFHSNHKDYHQGNNQQTPVRMGVEEEEPLSNASQSVNRATIMGINLQISQKNKNGTPISPIYTIKRTLHPWRYLHIMFISVLFTRARK